MRILDHVSAPCLSAAACACIVMAVLLQGLTIWAPAIAAAPLSVELDAISGSPHLKGSAFGLAVYSLNQRRFICSVDGGRPLVPASNQKLLVTAAALIELGPDFKFTTSIYADGHIKDGVLYGDLILRGGGDPNLSGRFNDGNDCDAVNAWVMAVWNAGITQITGRVVVDDSLFDTQFFHPSWPLNQTHKWYAAPIGALSLNESCINLTVEPTSIGSPPAFAFEPYTPDVTVRNVCKTVSGRLTKNIIVDRSDWEIYLGGKIGVQAHGYSANIAIHDPGLFAGSVFHERLCKAGIRPAGVVRAEEAPDYRNMRLLMEYHSRDMAATVRITNAQSQNFYANTLLKYLGARRFGRGTFDNGTAAVLDILRGRGILSDTVSMDDGGGLSHNNRVSTEDLVAVMETVYDSDCRDAYVGSLAVPGDPEGTLKKRLKGEHHNARVFAKSGYINKVKALSGYVLRDDGEVLIFAFIVNNYGWRSSLEVNKLQDRLMRSLSDSSLP